MQDYRRLNEYTIKNKYPLPLIIELIAQVKEAHTFTKFDIRWGYNNVCIKEGNEHKATFKTKYGLYEPLVMFFGLTNSPATFQTMMNHIFAPLQEKHCLLGTEIIVYMDNILIASSRSLNGHRSAVTDVLQLLEDHDLYLKLEKFVWEAPQVNYLGLILEKGVTHMDPNKLRASNLGHTHNCQTSSILYGVLQFLPTFYLQIHTCSKTPQFLDQKRHTLGMDHSPPTHL